MCECRVDGIVPSEPPGFAGGSNFQIGWSHDERDDRQVSEALIDNLPLFRRTFSQLDKTERNRLIEAVLGRTGKLPASLTLPPDNGDGWRTHLGVLEDMLKGTALS